MRGAVTVGELAYKESAMFLSKSVVEWMVDGGHAEPNGSKSYYTHTAAGLLANGKMPTATYKQLSIDSEEFSDYPDDEDEDDEFGDDDLEGIEDDSKSFFNKLNKSLHKLERVLEDMEDEDTMTEQKLFGGRNGSIRVKSPSEQYSTKRYAAKNKYGVEVYDPIYQREVVTQSEQAKASAGVLFKHLAQKAGIGVSLDEHERSLLDDLCENKEWAGKVNGEFYDAISPHRNIKALLDDSLSGGLEAVPIEFDSDLVSFALLGGELFPQVDLHPVSRGRRIEGASIQTPTMSWGGGDGTSITPFNTAAMVAAIDTTIFAIDCAVEIGRDFLSDSPVNVGQTLTGLVGERLTAELDKVISVGNGTTQPEGIFTSSGLTTVTTVNNTGGPPTLSDYMTLLFAIGKQYRTAANRVCFVSNDTTYQRSRGIKIDANNPSTDQRAVLDPMMQQFGGSLVNSYSTLGYAHKVCNEIPNSRAAVVAMAKYRMHRRLGLDIRFETGGATLARANTVLLVARARFGGKIIDPNAGAKWIVGQN